MQSNVQGKYQDAIYIYKNALDVREQRRQGTLKYFRARIQNHVGSLLNMNLPNGVMEHAYLRKSSARAARMTLNSLTQKILWHLPALQQFRLQCT